MPNRQRAPVDVDPLLVDPEQVHRGAGDRGERLIDLEEFHVVDTQTTPFERGLDRRRRHRCQVRRIGRRLAVGDPAGERRQAAPLRLGPAHHQHGCRAIVDARSVPGGHCAVRLEERLEASQPFDRRLRSGLLIGRDHGSSLGVDHRHRDELFRKATRCERGRIALLAAVRVLVLPFAGNLEFAGHVAPLHGHVVAIGWIGETVAHHAVDQGAVAQPVPEARLLEQVRSLAHALHPAGDDDLGVAVTDQQGRQVDGLQ